MKIALYDVDSAKVPNLALMKLARYHRECGDEVVMFDPKAPLLHSDADRVLASKVFTFSPAPYMHSGMEIGGTGWDMGVSLPHEIEALRPDYSIYPDRQQANLGFTMRGCRFRCDFCVVPKKEGQPYSTHTIDDLMVLDTNRLILLDNDPFGNPEWPDRIAEMRDRKLRVCFSQGINIRIISEEQAAALASVRFTNLRDSKNQATFAWDRPKDERLILRGIERCKAAGIKPWQMQFFVLIGFDSTPEEDLHRIEMLLAQGCDPYVMPYDKTVHYQRALARFVNARIAKKTPWMKYEYGGWKTSRDLPMYVAEIERKAA